MRNLLCTLFLLAIFIVSSQSMAAETNDPTRPIDWSAGDRLNFTERWNRANVLNLMRGVVGAAEYKSIAQRTDFYNWFDQIRKSQRHEILWPAAAWVVASQMRNLEDPLRSAALATRRMAIGRVVDSKKLLEFARAGNKAIFDDVFPKLQVVFQRGMLNNPLKGEEAKNWDRTTLHHEQFDVVQPIYEQYASKDQQMAAELRDLASGSDILGFSGIAIGNSLDFSGNILSPQDRFNHGIGTVVSTYSRFEKTIDASRDRRQQARPDPTAGRAVQSPSNAEKQESDNGERSSGIRGSITKTNLTRNIFVANGLFQARTTGVNGPIALAVVEASLQAGDDAAKAENRASSAMQVANSELDRWRALGFDLGLDPVEEQRRVLDAIRRSGVLGSAELAARVSGLLPSPSLLGKAGGVESSKLRLEIFQAAQAKLFESAYDRYDGGDMDYRGLFDRVLLPAIKARPGPVAEILASNPDFATQPAVKAAIDILQNAVRPDGTIAFDDASKTALFVTGQISTTTALEVVKSGAAILVGRGLTRDQLETALLDEVTKRSGVDVRRASAAAQKLKDGINLGNAEAGVYLAETALAFADPKAARDFGQVARASIQIAQVFSAFRSGAGLNNPLISMGAGAMTGGTLNAVMGVASLAGGMGGDSEMQSMLAQISAQIETMRTEMHARFDVVDAKLNAIHYEMQQQFAIVRGQLTKIDADLSKARASLLQLEQQLTFTETRVLAAIGDLLAAYRIGELSGCVDWLDHTSTVRMERSMYIRCMILMSNWATDIAALNINVGTAVPIGSPAESIELSRDPTQNIAFWFATADQLGTPIGSPGEFTSPASPRFVAPVIWLATTRAYARMAEAFPDDYADIRLEQLQRVAAAGANTLAEIERLRSGPTSKLLFDKLFADMEAARERFIEESSVAWQPVLADQKLWMAPATPPKDTISHCDFPSVLQLPSGDALGIPPQLRLAESLGLGKISICAMGAPKKGSSTTSVINLSLFITFNPQHGPSMKIGVIHLLSSREVEVPAMPTSCGYDNCGIPWEYNEWMKNVAKLTEQAWSQEFRQKWEGGEVDYSHLDGVKLAIIGRDVLDRRKDLAAAFRDRMYEALQDSANENIRRSLDDLTRTTQRLRGFTLLAFEAEVRSSEPLSALVEGGARLLDRSELSVLQARGSDILKLVEISKRRSKAFAELIAMEFAGVDQVSLQGDARQDAHAPIADGSSVRQQMMLQLNDLASLYQREAKRCGLGLRPAEECQSLERLPK